MLDAQHENLYSSSKKNPILTVFFPNTLVNREFYDTLLEEPPLTPVLLMADNPTID